MSKTPRPGAFYRPGSYRPDESVAYLMKRVLQSIQTQADRRLAEHGLTHAQWVPLYKLMHADCATVAALARDLQTDPGAMTRALDRLEAKGLVQRVRSTEDRRVVDLELTDEGRRTAKIVPPVLAEVLNAHLAGFSEAEWQGLKKMLQRMLANGDALKLGE
jgi:DNA-binding MarR family transcriptional regulator